MLKKVKALLIGDAMIPGKSFEGAYEKYLKRFIDQVKVGDWESDWGKLQNRRLEVEKKGPEIEEVDPLIKAEGKDASVLMGLFLPVSSKVFEAMPNLHIVGVSRAGLENVNVEEATKKGILVFNVKGRNAEAVSDYAVGMLLSECRNIARAFHSIKGGKWRKEFSNSSWVPELKGKNVGIVGFGYIGRLVAKKLSGFETNTMVYDPFVDAEVIKKAGAVPVDKETLFRESDFITLHARLSEETKNLVGEKELSLMKPTAYLINTARAGLVEEKALLNALKEKKIAGAGLDVFWTEPIPEGSDFLKLDNVTLSTHIAGTTKEALSRSPELLMEDIEKLLKNEETRFVVNPEVLQDERFKKWLDGVRKC
ncbi:MAG: 2-hydroxyacid dehydrogenase [Clostridium luticellarii]|jgi:D-3-phosphoglycerate dehydrogenase|uniref:2-hydroxyacid dehydrogenase n=1 Tax=Clostridium luticellarii TaxID=1691940 RepID=UPI0023559200|nr:2-hydroxyacid dehydrogenase [Clostridium luticellarii]MCI1945549.1 2-hydroxyacid dehydrogenase [Clostridium luticellarii]MCI1996393.1 2-hydroxyacid dehydrogenase [Clostridium luticellarii]MCI2040722.1 2-hydroxyacid dehydrogenase [Clostridium luticellarii]